MRKTILITGGAGMVGSQATFGIKLGKDELDVTKPRSIDRAIKLYKPDAILHLAALVNMSLCETDPELAYTLNVQGTEHVAKACKKHGIKMVYLSTCAVFDGKKRSPYTEKNIPHPLSMYGKTKEQGERMVKALLPDTLIVRTGWLFGGGKSDTRFARALYTKMKASEDIVAIDDRYGSPTYVPDLLQTIHTLIEKDEHGIVHVVNDGMASYFDVAKEIKKLGKFKTTITPVKAKSFRADTLYRGKMEALISAKLKLRSWKLALKEYLK